MPDTINALESAIEPNTIFIIKEKMKKKKSLYIVFFF